MSGGKQRRAGMLGSYAHVDALVDAVRAAVAKKIEVVDVYSPVPVEEVIHLLAPKTSLVRFGTFIGALCGLVGGLALGIGTSMIWDLVVSGKPVTSHVPFVVVGFEAMILLGALATLGALLFFAGLPLRRFPTPAYRPEFSLDQFGLWLSCDEGEVEATADFLQETGAQEVNRLGVDGGGQR